MYSDKNSVPACLLAASLLAALASCARTQKAEPDAPPPPAPTQPAAPPAVARHVTDAEFRSFTDMLADVSDGAGDVTAARAGRGGLRLCVFEEQRDSAAGRVEIALMLLRLNDRYGARHIALEGLMKDEALQAVDWPRMLGGGEEQLRHEILVGLLRDGVISAAEFIALAFPDVALNGADDPEAYAVGLTKTASAVSTAYLYKIGLKSVRPENQSYLERLNRRLKVAEMVEYVISLDDWARSRHARMSRGGGSSVAQVMRDLNEIEERARAVGADISDEERGALAEAKAFFEAAAARARTMFQVAVTINLSSQPRALNISREHAEGIRDLLDRAEVTYAVLSPLATSRRKRGGHAGCEATPGERRGSHAARGGEMFGDSLYGVKKPPPVLGRRWFVAASQLRLAAALLARASGERDFPAESLRKRLDSLDHLKISWGAVREENGGVIFMSSALVDGGWKNVWVRAVRPKGARPRTVKVGLEALLLESLNELRRAPIARRAAATSPPVRHVTPDVMAVFADEPSAVMGIRLRG